MPLRMQSKELTRICPYATIAQAVFALLYTHKKMGIIPDNILELGRADDSSVVRAVLIRNEKAFSLTPQPRASTGRKSPTSLEAQPPTPAYSSSVFRSMPMST